MSNRWIRFVIALLALVAAGAAGYRIHQQEQRLAVSAASTRTAAFAAERSIASISEIKAALHAYVAPGQGNDFWAGRAAMMIDSLRAAVLELDAAANTSGIAPTESLDSIDRLAASEQRAREHMRSEEARLAGDVIFNESRDLLDGLRLQIARARDQIAQHGDATESAIRREQATLAAGAAGIMALALLLLVPIAANAKSTAVVATPPLPATNGSPARHGSGETIASGPSVKTSPAAPNPPLRVVNLDAAARLCTDFGKIADSRELSTLLDRAADVLGASGIIVWMSSPDRRELFPAASAGYEARMIARIGSTPHDAANLTAAAFREGAVRTSAALGPSSAAIAAPLMAPDGAVGVLSAELRDVLDVDRDHIAFTTIFAAQLATLLGSMSAVETKRADPAAVDARPARSSP